MAAHERRVLAYALRRTATAADAEEVAAETFVIAWRRRGQVPEDPLPWLFGVARRLVANQRRARQRQLGLIARITQRGVDAPPTVAVGVEGPATRALVRLRPDDQELLRLVAWEELDHRSIGLMLGISENAVAIRLYRARQRFRDELLKDSGQIRTSTSTKGNLDGAVQEQPND
jgi:RNA polymerase sigma-70 factor (ECF subfamily)